MKYLILVGDGMADWPIPTRNNQTPLELAHIPNMDWLVTHGHFGRFQTVPEACAPGSEVANMSIMGYNPVTDLPGRGPLEALSAGVPMSATDIAFRCNIITIHEGKIKDYSSGHITTDEARPLIEAVQDNLHEPGIDFFPGVQYRHILRLDGTKFSDQLICTPPHDQLDKAYAQFLVKPKDPTDLIAEATAHKLNSLIERSAPILADHSINKSRIAGGKLPATHVWFWSGGKRPNILPYSQKYGKTGAVISAVDLIFGIGVAAGLEPIHVPGATGLLDTNYAGKINAAIDALTQKDFVYVHVEAPDEMGHAGDLEKKIQAIEDFDRNIVGPAIRAQERFSEGLRIAVLPDHPTPIQIRTHARDPVPITICDVKNPRIHHHSAQKFTEKESLKGDLPFFRSGAEMIQYFFDTQ
jgi:2,3-bisphosphoglycerate-independent phosphoglycerate mutase